MVEIYPPPDFTYRLYEDFIDPSGGGNADEITATAPILYDNVNYIISDTPASAVADGYVTTGAQTIAGTKNFSAVPQTAVAPTLPNDLCNLAYVGTGVGSVTATLPVLYNPATYVISEQAASATTSGHITTGAQQIEGTKTFIGGATEFQNGVGGPCTISTTVGGATIIGSADDMQVRAADGKDTELRAFTTGNVSMDSDYGICQARSVNGALQLYGKTGVDIQTIGIGAGDVTMDSADDVFIRADDNITVDAIGNVSIVSSTIGGGQISINPYSSGTVDFYGGINFHDGVPYVVADPTAGNQVTRKSYVDGLIPSPLKCWILTHDENLSSHGGDFLTGAWRTITINDISGDTSDTSCTISSNVMSLTVGSYLIFGKTQAFRVNDWKTRLRQTSPSGVTIKLGTNSRADAGDDTEPNSHIHVVVKPPGTYGYEFQGYCETDKTTSGFGHSVSLDSTRETFSLYTVIKYA